MTGAASAPAPRDTPRDTPGEETGRGNGGRQTPGSATVTVALGVNINLEIHIAADASPATIEEVFKNMRKYVLGGGTDGEAEEE